MNGINYLCVNNPIEVNYEGWLGYFGCIQHLVFYFSFGIILEQNF